MKIVKPQVSPLVGVLLYSCSFLLFSLTRTFGVHRAEVTWKRRENWENEADGRDWQRTMQTPSDGRSDALMSKCERDLSKAWCFLVKYPPDIICLSNILYTSYITFWWMSFTFEFYFGIAIGAGERFLSEIVSLSFSRWYRYRKY